jgi:FKBP-type peptidyl-prolyl cis-trans isomerase FklB
MMIARTKVINLLYLVSVAVFLSACNTPVGFEKVGDHVFKRLDKFGDCSPSIENAQHFIMQVRFKSLDNSEKKYEFQLHHHNLSKNRLRADEDTLNANIKQAITQMNCGDAITLRCPFYSFDNTFLSAYANESMFNLNENMELSLELLQTFEQGEYANYLLSASQQGEIGESEAIELLLMNEPEHDYQKHGDCYIQFFAHGIGDTLAVGDEILMNYNTFLLNGKKLDEPTEMQFRYGMPGQIVDGLHYALSFMRKGDEALVYMPSNLAFGSTGSSGQVVPRNTPVYFRIALSDDYRSLN